MYRIRQLRTLPLATFALALLAIPALAQSHGGGNTGVRFGFSGSSTTGGFGYRDTTTVTYGYNANVSHNVIRPGFGINTISNSEGLRITDTFQNRFGSTTTTFSTGYSLSGMVTGQNGLSAPTFYASPLLLNPGLGINPYSGYAGFGYAGNTYASPAMAAGVIAPANAGDLPNKEGVVGNWLSQRNPTAQEKLDAKAKEVGDKEIVSGEAINALIDQLIGYDRKGIKYDRDAAVDLAGINFASSHTPGQFGFLGLTDPLALPWKAGFEMLNQEGQLARKQIEADYKFLATAFKEGKPTQSDSKTLRKEIADLSDLVSAQIQDLGVVRYAEVKQFLKVLDGTVQYLQETPDFHPWKRGLKAGNVGEVAKLFAADRLRVAAALPGMEKAYAALYSTLRKAADEAAASAKAE